MRIHNFKKKLALWVTICMVFQMFGGMGLTIASAAPSDPGTIHSMGVVTGAAISYTYYVGGAGADDANDGTTADTPFATLAQAADIVSDIGSGSFHILVQGNTNETRGVEFIGEANNYKVSICNSVTGSAIVMRDSGYTEDLMYINNVSVTIGDSNGSNDLIFDGGSGIGTEAREELIYLGSAGSLTLYSNTYLQNNGTPTGLNGGGIYNRGTVNMYGGTIRGNCSNSGGGIYNYGFLYIYGGSFTNNIARIGGGICNRGIMEIQGGTIAGNTAESGGGIYNRLGMLTIKDGVTISNNSATREGGGIFDEGSTELMGGSISNNTSPRGGAISAAGRMVLSGSPSIPAGTGNTNDIYVYRSLYIRTYIYTPEKSIAITPAILAEGYNPIILGATEHITALSVGVFDLTIPNYKINSQGFLEYDGPLTDYYVGGTGAADSNSGTAPESPFASLSAAIAANGEAGCTITVQDDLVITDTVNVTGHVNIISDGNRHTISGSDTLSGNLFYIDENTLILGNTVNTVSTDQLVFTLSNKSSVEEGFQIVEYGKLEIYSGVMLEDFPAGAIYNSGLLNIYGGTVRNCDGDYAIINELIFNMYGGTLQGNSGKSVVNYGRFSMTGGEITDYTICGIDNYRALELSGDINISSGQADSYGIYLWNGSTIVVSGKLETTKPICLDMESYAVGILILEGDTNIIRENASKFTFALGDGNYKISSTGYLEYSDTIKNYYVNEELTEIGDGSLESPFNTLAAAITAIGKGAGNIILKSDAIVHEPIFIGGTVNLLSDGEVRTVLRGNDFIPHVNKGEYGDYFGDSEDLFDVYGKLILGDSNFSGSDSNPTLILDGGRELAVPILESGALIGNIQSLILYPGVALQNNDSIAIGNLGSLKMYGGVIRNNSSDEIASGVLSQGTFEMYGGLITGNTGDLVGVLVESSEFHMYGGTISGNTGGNAGVFVSRGIFTMDGGSISGNIGSGADMINVSGVTVASGEFYMNGGSITGNEGDLTGVYLYGGKLLKSFGSIDSFKEGPINNVPGIMYMTGGSITGNKGLMSGIYTYTDGIVDMQGGTIENNDSTYSGILAYEKESVRLGGNAALEGNSLILLNDVLDNGITIVSPLTTSIPIMATYLAEDDELTSELMIGKQLLISGDDYLFTPEDADKFVFADPALGVNSNGQVGYAIKDSWVSFGDTSDKYFDGQSKSVTITVNDGAVTLIRDTDYTVSYKDNYNCGTAQVIVRGIGNYAGKVTCSFNIRKSIVKKLLTANPAVQTFKADDNKTPDQLLASIGLAWAEVETEQGTILMVPVIWSLTGGVYNPRGGTYTYTGSLDGRGNIDTKGFTLTTQIKVLAVNPEGSTVVNAGGGGGYFPADISYNTDSGSFDIDVRLGNEKDSTGKKLVIPLSSEDIIDQIRISDAEQIHIFATLPGTRLSDDTLDMTDLLLTAELLQAAKDTGKDIMVSVYDETGSERYSWTFTSENLNNSKQEFKDVNLFFDVKSAGSDGDLKALLEKDGNSLENSLIINFGQDGVLPSQAGVRIYVGDQPGISEGSTVYLYHYNQESKKLEALPFSSGYTVDKDGYITLDIVHCSDYVLLNKEAGSTVLTPLKDQITVTASTTELYFGGTKDASAQIMLNLPSTLEQVASLSDKTSGSAIGGVTVSYRSGNKKVATIDANGLVTAAGTGIASIFTTVTLYSGETMIFETKIHVKKPYIVFTKSTSSMKIGDTFTFKVQAYGLEAKDIVWTTSKKSIVTITATTGKAKAVSKGTDYVIVMIGKVEIKIKVIVK